MLFISHFRIWKDAYPDDFTVVIHYKTPFAPLLQGLSLPYLGIQSPAYLKNTPNTSNTVVGSGPFILKSFVKGNGSQLTRRDDYQWGPGYAHHQGPAWLSAINFKYLPGTCPLVNAPNRTEDSGRYLKLMAESHAGP